MAGDKVSSSNVSAIIPAAGQGLRFGGKGLKQFKLLAGKPLFVHALEVFAFHDDINEIVIPVPADKVELTKAEIASRSFKKPVTVVAGGARRQDSVQNGLNALTGTAEIVVIHDAGRPFITTGMISGVIAGCKNHDGAIVAQPASDTVKLVNPGSHHISKTIPRETIWLAQTPQAFRQPQLQEAMATASRDGIAGTDEASLLERLGHIVAIVPGSPENLKITSPEDWQQAAAILEGKK